MSGPMFTGKVVVITGATGGIGLATARRFAEEGARPILLDIDPVVERIAAELEAEFRIPHCAVLADLRSSADIDRAMGTIVAEHGRVDVLVNNAGIFPVRPFDELDDAIVADVFNVNVRGMMRTCRAVIPYMRAARRGVIVNIASGSAFTPIAGLTVYGASKAAIVAFSRSLALEIAPDIRVNIVSPGTTASPPVEQAMAARGADGFAEFLKHIPLGRLARPEDIAEAILFMASDRAAHITGTTLPVNGGSLMR